MAPGDNSAPNFPSVLIGANPVPNSTTHPDVVGPDGSGSPYSPELDAFGNHGGLTETCPPVYFSQTSFSRVIDNGANTAGGLNSDQRGSLFVRTNPLVGGTVAINYADGTDVGAVEVQLLTVASVVINNGAVQRSEVRTIAVTFSLPVTFTGGDANAAAAFQLYHAQTNTNIANLQAAVSTNTVGQTVVTFTFTTTGNAAADVDPESTQYMTGAATTPSLGDGRYQLTAFHGNITTLYGQSLAGDGTTVGSDYVTPTETSYDPAALHLYRIYGDATGDGTVDLSDLTVFRNTYNATLGQASFVDYLDADNDAVIDLDDLDAFRNRYNGTVF
jgi:hypothetical protein